jgi:hypothetical protein
MPNPEYQLISADGIFKMDPEVEQALLDETEI